MKKIISLLSAGIILLAPMTAFANSSIPAERQQPRLVDNADILTESEEETILSKLDSISESHNCDVAIVTVASLGDKTATEYADDFYDYNGYGMGDEDNGILLLLSMEARDWAITTYGSAITAFTDKGQANLMDNYVLPQFKYDNWNDGFIKFADLCDDYLTKAETGEPYNESSIPDSQFSYAVIVGWSVILGVIISLIVVLIMKSQLKSVKKQDLALEYAKKDSMKVTKSNEIYLYKNVIKKAIPKDSSTHTSSSGRSHGGSSGKF